MSGRRSKKNQRLGSSRRGPKGLNSNIEKDEDEFQQIAESEDGRNVFHTSTDYHSTQFDHPPSSSIDQQTSALECPPHARGHKDSLMENELPERKRKMGSTRKTTGRIKVERKLDEMRTTEELDEEYLTQPNTSTTEAQHASLTEEQSKSMSFPSDLSLQTKSSELGKEPGTTLMFAVLENEEKDAIHYQEITSHSHEVVSDMPIAEAMVPSVHSIAVTVAESDLLQKDSVMFDEPSLQEIPIASTSGQKRRMGSTRRPLRGKNCENVGVQENSRNMIEDESKAEVIDEAKFTMSVEMTQTWDDVARDVSTSHTESALVLNQSLLAERAELKEPDVSAGTETMIQSVAFPLVDSEKPLPETSSHHGTPLLNKGLDFNFGSHTEDFVNKVWKEAESNLSDNSQWVPDTRKDTNTSHNFRDVNKEVKEEVLKQKEELSINDHLSNLLPKQDAQLEEHALNDQEYSLSQHDIATLDNNCDCSMAQLIVGGSRSFGVPVSNISHAEPTAINLPHEMSDAAEEMQEIHMEIKQESNVCDVASITCDTLTDLECIMEENEDPQIFAARENENTSDQRGSETDNAFEISDQGDVRDHNVTQIIMDVRDNEKDGETSTETIWISHQKPCEVPSEKEGLIREQEQYSSNISQTHSPLQDDAGKMLETDEVRKGKKDSENAAGNDVTTRSEEIFSFKVSATDTGSHAHQHLFMQSPDKDGYDSHENVNEKSEKEGILFSVESENAAFDRGEGKSEGTEGIKDMDAEPVVISNVDTVYNDSESKNKSNRELTGEQTDTSSDTNLQILQVLDNVSSLIDSGLLLHDVVISPGEREAVPEESDISSFIPEDSQDSNNLTTFYPESQDNTADSERAAVGGDTDLHLEIEAQNKTFNSTTSETEGTKENIHYPSVLMRDVEVIGDTGTVESNVTTGSDFLHTSDIQMEALKVSTNAEKEDSGETDTILLQSDINIIPEEAHSKSSPVIHKRKMGSTRRPFKGNKGQRKNHDENEIFILVDEPNPDESRYTAVSRDTELHLEKTFDSTAFGGEATEENICEASVLVKEVEFIGDTVTVDSNMTTESDLIQNDTSSDAKLEALKASDNAECEVQEETDAVPKQSDTTIIPEDTQREEAHSEFTVIHKRKMGSTRRPLRGKNAQRKEKEHLDENETPDSEGIINVDKETISLENEPSLDESTLQSIKDGVKEQEMEICEKNDVGPVVGSKSTDLQSLCSSDLTSEESTAISICHIKEPQTLMKLNEGSQENAGDAERVAVGGETDLHLEIKAQIKTSDSTSEAEASEENICEASVLFKEVEFIGDTVTVESNITTESDFLQSSPDSLKVSQNSVKEVSGETDTILKQSHINIIPEDSHREEAHSKSSPVIHKRKMGSTRRPLKGNKGQRKEKEHHDENESLECEGIVSVEKKTFSLEDESSTNASPLRTTKDGVKQQEMELCEENDVGPVEGSESALLQSSCSSDLLSEDSTTVSICHVTELQTLMKLNEESQENAGDAEKLATEEDKDLQLKNESQNKMFDSTTSEAEGKEENISDVSVTLLREVEVNRDTGTVESNMTTESDFLQTSPDAHIEALKISEIAEKVPGETDTILKQSDISIIPQDSHREEAHSKSSPVIHKRKMGSTRRPLKGNKGQREEHDEKEIFSLEDEPSPDESRHTAVNVCDISESQTFSKIHAGSQENTGDVEIVPADGDTERHLENKTFESTAFGGEATEENICEASVLVKEVEFIGDTVTVDSNMTTESDLIQNDTSSDAKLEALKVSDNAEREVQKETDEVPKQSDTTIIPEDTQREEAHSEFTVIHKRKMGSTRRPLRGKNAQRKEKEHLDENETPDSEGIINVEEETIRLENEPSLDESTLQSLKVGVKEQEIEICEKNDVGPVEGSESALLQSSCSSDLLSEESIAVSICHVTESQTLMKPNEVSRENAGVAEKLAAEEDKDLQLKTESQNKMFDSTTSEAEGTEENISDVSVTLLREVEVNRDTGTVESNMTTESDFLQTSPDAHIEALKISENAEKEVPGETDTILKQSDISIIPDDSHREDAHSKSSPVIHKRKMGSTRRPLKGNKGQKPEHDEKEIFSLEDESSPDESRHTAVNVCDISESQTFPKIHAGSQENTGDVEIVSADGDTERHLENKTFDSKAFGGEATEENICEASVLVKEVEFIGDTVTVDSNMTTESDMIQNDTSSDAKLEALKVSDNAECEVQEETDAVPKQSDTTIIPEETQREEAHSEFTVIHKRKMGSTRRPLRGKNAQRKEKEHLDENETPDSEGIINVDKETISLENEPSLDESTLQSIKDGVKEQEMEICEKNDVGPVVGSKSTDLQSLCSSDLTSEESTAISICHIKEPQTLMKLNEGSQENAGDAERVAVGGETDLHLEIKAQIKTSDSTSEAEASEENICEASVLFKEVEFIGDTVTVESNITTESDFLQSSPDALKVSQNSVKEVSGETDTILKQSHINIIPEDSHREEAHSKSSPVIHKRKMGSTRRPLKGNKGQRKEKEHHDENESLECEGIISVEKKTFSLEDESSTNASPLRTTKDGVKQQEMELCEENDVGPVEGSESALLQSSCSSDLLSEDSTTVSICHVTELQTLMKLNEESQENAGDAEKLATEEDKDLQLKNESQNKMFDSTTSEAEGKEENISDVSVTLLREVEVNRDTGTVESNMTTESDFLQTSPDAHIEALKISEIAEKVPGETDTILKQSDISIIPQDSHREEAHSKSSPVIHKRKMGSTRRPLKGNKGQREEHDEKEIFSLEDEPSPDESRHTAVNVCDISESQTFSKIHAGSQENTGDVEIVPADGDTERHLENKTFESTAFGGEATEENICEASVLVKEVEFIGDTVTVDSNMTTESDLIQNDTSSDAKLEALKVSDNAEREVQKETDEVPKQSDTTIIPEDTQREEAHSEFTVIHKRKMGSTRRPLRGKNAQRKEKEHLDENETPDSEGIINVEEETIRLENEPSLDESTLQSLKVGVKEQEIEICEKNDVGPVEGSESALLQSSCSSDLLSEESIAVSICHVTESQTLMKPNEVSRENAGVAEKLAAEEDKDLQLKTESQNKMFDSTTSEAEGTEENISDVSVTLLREVEVNRDTGTVESNMTTESDFLQTSPDAHIEALKISENAEKEVSRGTDTILKQSDISIFPQDSHREEAHSKSSPVIHKRKMGSTRRPLKGNKGQRPEHHEKEIFSLEDEPSPDESRHTAVNACDISESQTFPKIHAGSQENTGDVEIVSADGDTELHLENKTFDSTAFREEATEENICEASVLVKEVEFIGDTVTVDSNMTTESDLIQNDTSSDAKPEALKVSDNAECEVQEETDAVPKQSDTTIIPEDIQREESHSEFTVIHKRKMGSTRRPLRGKNAQRKEKEHLDENETPDSEGIINVEEETISLENEPSTNASPLRTSKNGVKEQEMELCEENDVGPVEGSESAFLQSSCSSDLLSEESTAVSICHVTESQTLMKLNEESQENAGDAEKLAAEEEKDLKLKTESQNKIFDSTTSEAEGTEENISDVSVTLLREVEVNRDTGTLESNMTTESNFLQTSPDAHIEALKISENAEKEVSGETDTILQQSDISIIPDDSHREEAHSKSSPVIHKRKMGSTRRPLKGNKGQRPEHDEKEIFSLEDEPSPHESRNTAVNVCDISELQTLPKIHAGSQENTGDVEIVSADGDTERHLENKTFDSTTFGGEATEENICEASVLVKEVEFIGDTVTVDSNMTTESDLIQNDTSSDAKLEALKVSDNAECEVQEETDAVPKQSDTTIIPEDTQREEAHSEFTVIHKRKMGSTRRPLRGKNAQRKEKEHLDENETPDSEGIINVEEETISLKNEPSTNASTLRTSKDVFKEQEMELCEENDVGPVEGSESALLQSSFSSDLLSEESTAVSICHITELQTLVNLNEESQKNAGDAEKLAAEEDKDLQLKTESQNKMFDSTTSEAEGTEKNISDVSVTLLREVEVNRDTGTVESNMTTESDFLQTSPDAHIEALKISENAEKEVSRGTDTILQQNDISIIPEDSHREDAHSKSSPVIHKRKMGSTRRPLKGNKEQRPEHDEKEIFSLEDESSPDESRHTAVNVCDISESQTFPKIHAGSQENTGDVEIVSADADTELHLENKTFDSTAFGGEATEENICEASVLVKEVEFIGDTVTVDSNMTTESDLIQNDTSSDAKLEALKVSDNAECEVQKETDAVPKQSDTTIIPEDIQREEAHSEFTVIHKRKMGSTRRPLRGKNAQRKEKEHLDENEKPDSEGIINVEEETIRLENEPSLDESTLQSLKVGLKEQEIEICEKNDVGPVEGSESALLQSSCSSDLLSEESTAVSICHVTELQTLVNLNEESQENAGVAEKLAAEEDKDLQLKTESQNKMFDSTTSEAEGTEENISDVSVTLLREVEVIGDTGTVESNMTTESDFLQTSPDAHIEALKISENAEKEVSRGTDTILKQSDISIFPQDSHREEAHSKSSPVIHKRKMGSTRRPLKGNKGQREEHDEKEIFSLEDEPSPNESRYSAVNVCDISESQILPKIHVGSQENTGDVEIVSADGDTERHLENKTFDSTAFGGEATEENICEASVLVKEVKFIGDTVTVDSNMTTESDLIQNDTSSDAKLEALKVSDNAECEVQEETDTVPKQSDTTIIPEDIQREEAHSEFTVIHKRKMGSTRRPLRGKNAQRKEKEHLDENETPDSEGSINVVKETISLEDEPSLDESTLQSLKDGVKEQEIEICEKNDVGPVEGSKSTDLQSLCSSDLTSEESTVISICHITESQTLMKLNEESQDNAGDAERVAVGGETDLHLEIKAQIQTSDSTSEAEATEENTHDASVLVRKIEIIGDTVTVDSNMTTESDFIQNYTSSDAKLEALKVSDNAECEVQEETDAVPKQSDTTIIPEETQREEAHSEFTVIHKRKMGSTRRPLRGNKGQRQEHDEKEIFSLEDEPSPDESRNTAVNVCDISESQTFPKVHAGSQENTGDVEIVPADGDTERHLENKTFDSTTFGGEATEENICEASVLVKEVEFIGDTVTVDSNMTTESDLIQNDTSSDAKLEALKVSDNAEREVQEETDAVPKQSDTTIIPEDIQREEAHSEFTVIHKRKMGSTRRPLRGKNAQRKENEHLDENETPDSEGSINVEKETISLEDEPSLDESTLQSLKDGVKEQEMEICEKNDVGPVEGSKSTDLQSLCSSDLTSEESTVISICHITESQTLMKLNEESQDNDGYAERVAVGGETDLHVEIKAQVKTSDSTSEAEATEENICEASALVKEVEFIGDTVTVESNITTESDFLQSSPDALKVSQNSAKEVSGETDTILKQSDISIIPEDSHREEAHSKSSPVIHKRKMGSTRRPLKGNKGKRKDHDEKEIFSLEDEPSPDESRHTAVNVCDISESQTFPKIHAGSQKNTGDVEIAPAEGDTEQHLENKTFDSTAFGGEATEENICEASVLVKEVEFIGDTVTVESNITTESVFIQSSPDALKVSQNSAKEVLGETDTILKQSNISIIPEDSHREEAHSKSSPVIHKRKMGSTRRPLKGKNGQRNEKEHHDENETPDSEHMFNVEKETISLEDQPMYTAVSDILESQTLTKFHAESQEDYKDVERALVGRDTEPRSVQTEMTTLNSATFEGEGTEEIICEASVVVKEIEFIGDTVSMESNMTIKSDLLQSDISTDAKPEALMSEIENEGKTDTIPKQSDTNIIPEVPHGEEVHTKLNLNVQKRKMGSTCRPLRGNKGQRKVRVESEEKNGNSEPLSEEEDTETHLEIQNQDNVVDHNVTQEFLNIRDNKDEERKTTKTVEELCDDLKLEQRSDVSQTQSGPSQDDTGSHLLEVPERTADFVIDRFAGRSHSDLFLSDALLAEETQIHVSSEDVLPTEMAEMHPVSKRSMQKRKMGSTRKRGKRMVNDEEVEEEKDGEAENTTNDDGTTKSEENLTVEEAIVGSPVPQQLFSSSAHKESHEIQDIVSKSDVQTDISEQNDPNSTINPELSIEFECYSNVAAEMVSDLPLGDADTYLGQKQSVIPKESHREDQSSLNPIVQKRKMGSTRKTLRGNKGLGKEEESKKMDRESEEMTQEQDTEPHLATSERKTASKFDEEVEQNFPVEFPYPVAFSKMFPESENGGKEVSLNIHDLSEVSEEKESTGNDSNSENEAINLYDGTKDKFVLTVSHKEVDQTVSVDVYVGSEPEQTENTGHVFPTQELKSTQDDVVHEISSTQEKRRKMGSTRRNPRVIHGENMADNEDVLGVAEDRETKKAEDDLDDMLLASSIIQSKEVSSVSTTDLESEILGSATDLKEENHHQNNSEPSGPTVPETLQLVNADVTKHPQSETVTTENRRKMGSTRKNLREGRIQGKRDGYEETETADTNLQMSQDSEMSLGDQTTHDYFNQSEDSLLSEIERALNKTSQSSMSNDRESVVKEPNHIANAPDLSMPENSEIKSLQPTPLAHSEPNSPGRRRKMGSTRKNPRQQLKAEREDEDKEDEEKDENLKTNKQENKDLERVEVSIIPNITENKLNKEYLDVSSAHTSSSELEESTNPVSQERTSPSTKRKFGSRRTNKGKQGLGSLATSDFGNELEDGDHKLDSSEVEDKLCSDDSEVCDPCLTLQPENQPITHPVSEQRNMEVKNEEVAAKGTVDDPVSSEQIIKHDRSTGAKQAVNLKNRISDAEVVQFNVVMVGNSSVGKTSFIRRFHEGQFNEDYRSTIGVDTCIQTIDLPDRTVKLQIWDTAGQERFHSITSQVFHRADGLLLMYEITCSNSFISVRDWISRAQERAPDDVIMMLLGNKNDSLERAVQIQEGADLAREYNINFMECSAATGANVSESMRTLAELLVQRKSEKERHTTLKREPSQKKSGCC